MVSSKEWWLMLSGCLIFMALVIGGCYKIISCKDDKARENARKTEIVKQEIESYNVGDKLDKGWHYVYGRNTISTIVYEKGKGYTKVKVSIEAKSTTPKGDVWIGGLYIYIFTIDENYVITNIWSDKAI